MCFRATFPHFSRNISQKFVSMKDAHYAKGVMLKEEIIKMGKWGFFIVEAKVGMGVQKRCQEFAKGRE